MRFQTTHATAYNVTLHFHLELLTYQSGLIVKPVSYHLQQVHSYGHDKQMKNI